MTEQHHLTLPRTATLALANYLELQAKALEKDHLNPRTHQVEPPDIGYEVALMRRWVRMIRRAKGSGG